MSDSGQSAMTGREGLSTPPSTLHRGNLPPRVSSAASSARSARGSTLSWGSGGGGGHAPDADLAALQEALAPAGDQSCKICKGKFDDPDRVIRNGTFVHRRCYSAVRCAERMGQKDHNFRGIMNDMRATDPDKYLTIVMCLRTSEDQPNRTSHQRLHMKTFVKAMEKKTVITRQEGFILVTKKQWMAWHHFNELMPVEEAEAFWETELRNPGRYREVHAETGEVFLAIKTPASITRQESIAKSKRVDEVQAVPSASQARAQLRDMDVEEATDADFDAIGVGTGALEQMGFAYMDGNGPSSAADSSGAAFGTPAAKRTRLDAAALHAHAAAPAAAAALSRSAAGGGPCVETSSQ